MGALHEDGNITFIVSRSLLRRMKNVSEKKVFSIFFFSKILPVMR